MSMNKVQNAHISTSLPQLHRALIDILSVMNRPERDEGMLQMAGLSLERALFPLIVLIERLGPIGVVDLAGRVEELGLVARRPSAADRRVREAVITLQGKAATDAVDAARERLALTLFKDWDRGDFDDLLRLMRQLADSMTAAPAALD